jgi:hypothetical protein
LRRIAPNCAELRRIAPNCAELRGVPNASSSSVAWMPHASGPLAKISACSFCADVTAAPAASTSAPPSA